MSAEEIERLRELLAKATAQPWQIRHDLDRYGRTEVCGNIDGEVRDSTWDYSYEQVADTDCRHARDEANAALIVAAVNALPSLLSDLDRLAADKARLEEALRPFAAVAEHDIGADEHDNDDHRPMSRPYNRAPRIRIGDLRRARATLKQGNAAKNGVTDPRSLPGYAAGEATETERANKAEVALAALPDHATRIERLKAACEGELHGLAIDDDVAAAILDYVETGQDPNERVRR